jgi:hypothetical protein
MIEAKDAVVWINRDDKAVMVTGAEISRRHLRIQAPGHWSDPIGAAYTQWQKMTNDQRARLMTETAIDLAMDGFDLADVLHEFAKVDAFRKLGGKSHPMCRALTKAMTGTAYDMNTMSFEELLEDHASDERARAHKGQW